MAERDFSDILDDCITRLASGQTIDDCLLDYPERASDLRPMLEAGLLTRRISINPLEIRQAKDRVRFRLESRRRPSRNRQVWTASGVLLAALAIIFIGALLFADSSLPGDPLYGLKRFSETARLVTGGGNDAGLREQFEQRRLAEIAGLLARRRAADVTFKGELQATEASNWRVSGFPLIVSPTVPGAQTAQVGDEIEVQASTTIQGTLVARSIALLQHDPRNDLQPTITPSVVITSSPEPTLTPTATPSRTLTSSPTLTTTPTVTPTRKASLVPATTKPPTIAPPAQPTLASSPDPAPTRSGNKGSGGSSGSGGSGSSGSGSGGSGGSGGNDGSDDSGHSGSGSDDHSGDD
jgi:uncharacterized membrane protein YgcG